MGSELYEALGLEPGATPDEIKAAYRKQAKAAHPDASGGSDEAFHEVNRAYVVLSDPDKRARYDAGEDVDAGPDNRAALIHQCVISHFMTVMQRGDIEHDDLIEDTRQAIRQTLAGTRQNIGHVETVIAKLEGIIARLKPKEAEDKPDFLSHALRRQLQDARRELTNLIERSEAEEEAIEACDAFDYEVDARPVNDADAEFARLHQSIRSIDAARIHMSQADI